MKKGWKIKLLVFSILLVVLSINSYSENLFGQIEGLPVGTEIKVSILNNNPSCGGICSGTIDVKDFFEIEFDYLINDTITIYTEFEDILSTDTYVVDKIPFMVKLHVCDPPSKPILYEIDEIHETSVELHFLADDADYTVFSLDDSNYLEQDSPAVFDNLNAGEHTWKVKACGNGCCSKEEYSSFIVSNEVPTVPNITQKDNKVVIKAGTDNESDITFVEYKINDGEPIRSNHFDMSNIVLHARTCDHFSCSQWQSQRINTCSEGSVSTSDKLLGENINYSVFFEDVKQLFYAESNFDLDSDIECAKEITTGFQGLKEILGSKINQAHLFSINTNVPHTIVMGSDLEVDIYFNSDKVYDNLSMTLFSKYIGMDTKEFGYVVDDSSLSSRLILNTKKLEKGTYPIIVSVHNGKDILYTKKFNTEVIYTLNDMEYKLNEIGQRSKGAFGIISNILVIILFFLLCLYLVENKKLRKEVLICEQNKQKSEKEKNLAMSMLKQKRDVDNLQDDVKE